MLPSINQLADGSDDPAVKNLAGTAALLLRNASLQDSSFTEHSITRVIFRLEGAEGSDAQRVEPALTALKHLRDVLETHSHASRDQDTEHTSSSPIDIHTPEHVLSGSPLASRQASSLHSFSSVGGSGFGGRSTGGGAEAAEELQCLSLEDFADGPASAQPSFSGHLQVTGRASGEFGGRAAGGSSPYGSPPCSSPAHSRRDMTSYSPGTSMRMLQSDLRKVALTDDTQDDFFGAF